MRSPSPTASSRRIAGVALTAVAMLAVPQGTTAHAAAQEAATVLPGCSPVVMLTARGSSEPLTGGHGPTMNRIVDAVHETSLKDGFEGATIPARAIPYPAVGMDQYITTDDTTDLFDSVQYGVLFGQAIIDSITHEGCPDTKFILAGYSQGVLVARQLAENLGPDRVAGVLGVGDPAQKGDMPRISGGGKHGDGIYRWVIHDEEGGASSDSFYDAGIDYQMWCHAQDWICNFYDEKNRPKDAYNPLFQTYDHSYAEDPSESIAIGAVAAVMARDAIAAPSTDGATPDSSPDGSGPTSGTAGPGTPGREVDVVFAIDTTGSMGPYIDEARQTASKIVGKLRDSAKIVKVGVVEYRDIHEDFQARFATDLTTDQAAVQTALDGLVPDAGGDDPESVYSGVMMALRAHWTPGAIRSVVVLGDAPAKDPEPGTGYTEQTVTKAMTDLSSIPKLPPTLGDGADTSPSAYSVTHRLMAATPALFTLPAVTAAKPPRAAVDPTGVDVSLFAITPNSELDEQLTPVASATGGRVTAVDTGADGADDVSGALLDTMDLIAHPLTAALAKPIAVYAGIPFVLNAGASSTLPNSQFRFDVDGDGIYDGSSSASAQWMTVSKPGAYDATVQITDTADRTATAAVHYVVLPRSQLNGVPHRSSWYQVGSAATTVGAVVVSLLCGFGIGYWRGRRRPSFATSSSNATGKPTHN